MLQALAFYLFAAVLVLSAVMVITARNPVHSVLFLILAFFNAAGLFVLLGAEFVAMILVIVYVGAVAVLFLFVVMMLDINFADLRKGVMQYLPVGIAAGGVLLAELFVMAGAWVLRRKHRAIFLLRLRLWGAMSQIQRLWGAYFIPITFLFSRFRGLFCSWP